MPRMDFIRNSMIAAALHALWRGAVQLQRAWAAARARGELHQLSDRTLKDIGLTRAEIDALFR